jgi:hypothetical protein
MVVLGIKGFRESSISTRGTIKTRADRRRLVTQVFWVKADSQEILWTNSDTEIRTKARPRKQICISLILLTVDGSKGGFESRKFNDHSLYNKADIIKIRPEMSNNPLGILNRKYFLLFLTMLICFSYFIMHYRLKLFVAHRCTLWCACP